MKQPIHFYVLLVLLFSSVQAELSNEAYAFSNLFERTEMIVSGTVVDVSKDQEFYDINFLIEDCIMGNCNENIIQIRVPMSDGFYIPHESYLDVDESSIVFLQANRGAWQISNSMAGVLNTAMKNDVILLAQQYAVNRTIFSSSPAMQDLFNSLTERDSKIRLLHDLERHLDVSDESFLGGLLQSEDKYISNFAILNAGRLNMESFRHDITKTLIQDLDPETSFYCIIALGNYARGESTPIILPYLNNTDAGIRRVAIEALGKIGSDDVVAPLQSSYFREDDFVQRLAVIEAILRVRNLAIATNTLRAFEATETNQTLRAILANRLSSRGGN